ncbi:hypothetical protein ABZS89_43520, partial [Streptomyces sp. NPDC005407]
RSMELVESLCDWVAVMAAGRIRVQGPLAEAHRSVGGGRMNGPFAWGRSVPGQAVTTRRARSR